MQPLVIDTETDGLLRHKGAKMFAYATAEWDGADVDAARVEVYRLDGKDRDKADRRLRELWSDEGKQRYAKICHNARFDAGMVQDYLGRDLRGHTVHETMALSHIFQNDHYSHKLDDLAWDWFGYPKADDRVKPYLNDDMGLLGCPEWLLTPYQRHDVVRTMLLFQLLHPKLKENGWEEIYEMECTLVWTTLSIEDRGVMVDVPRCREMQAWLRGEADRALADFRSITGTHGTPLGGNLPRVLQGMGFELKKTTRSGRPSTDKGVIEELRERTKHPVFDAILRYRSYGRGVSIIEGYVDAADGDDVVHPQIHPYRAKTGREACAKPNLQNVSKETTLRSPYPIPARRCFRPKPGYVNFHVDYAGIEARLLVHFSGDEEALRIFQTPGGDFHTEAALELYGDDFARVSKAREYKRWKSLRDAAKNADFAIGYGAAPAKVAATLGVAPAAGKAGFARFKRRFPGYAAMPRHFAETVRANGYVDTIFGRRLRLPRNKPYVGSNYAVQGAAAGVLKRAQNRVDRYLRRATSGEAAIILPIHDEIIIEWPRKRLGEARACLREIRELMVDFPQLNVPLEIEVDLSVRDWASAKEYRIERAA